MEVIIIVTSSCKFSSLYIVKEELKTDLGDTYKNICGIVKIGSDLSFQIIWKWR